MFFLVNKEKTISKHAKNVKKMLKWKHTIFFNEELFERL